MSAEPGKTWKHLRWYEPHPAAPDLTETFAGGTEALCLTCRSQGANEAVRLSAVGPTT